MLPKSFSATALQTAASCHARYHAENLARTRGFTGNAAANLGTSVHGALELYVKDYMKTNEPRDLKWLIDIFGMQMMMVFKLDSLDKRSQPYKDGVKMLTEWHARMLPTWGDFTVVSCEVKSNFPVKTSVGEIPFNYIWDRFDDLGDGEYRVVDYKTNAWAVTPAELLHKIQARMYGLAAQIQMKEATKIWVEFDMLRHGGPVAVSYTRADNAESWSFIKERAEGIIAAEVDIDNQMTAGKDENEALKKHENLNGECLFCVRKSTCASIRKDRNIGGITNFETVEEIIDARAAAELQVKALNASLKEFDKLVIEAAKREDRMDFETETNELRIGVSGRRSAEGEFIEKIVGPELFHQYGGSATMTMKALDELLKSTDITDEQRKQIKGLITTTYGEPSVRVKPKPLI